MIYIYNFSWYFESHYWGWYCLILVSKWNITLSVFLKWHVYLCMCWVVPVLWQFQAILICHKQCKWPLNGGCWMSSPRHSLFRIFLVIWCNILFHCQQNCDWLITTNICTCHDSIAVVACAKFCSVMMAWYWNRRKSYFVWVWVLSEKSLVRQTQSLQDGCLFLDVFQRLPKSWWWKKKGCCFKAVIFIYIYMINIKIIYSKNALVWVYMDVIDDTWCLRAMHHYLSQYWPISTTCQ